MVKKSYKHLYEAFYVYTYLQINEDDISKKKLNS